MHPSQSIKSRLTRRLNKILITGLGGRGAEGPVWVTHPEFQALIERSKNILTLLLVIQQQIAQRLQQLESMVLGNCNN